MIVIAARKPTPISIVGCKPAPFTFPAARSPAVAFTAAVGSTIPAIACGQFTVSKIGSIDGSTLIIGTRATNMGKGSGELYSREKEARELHDDVSAKV